MEEEEETKKKKKKKISSLQRPYTQIKIANLILQYFWVFRKLVDTKKKIPYLLNERVKLPNSRKKSQCVQEI